MNSPDGAFVVHTSPSCPSCQSEERLRIFLSSSSLFSCPSSRRAQVQNDNLKFELSVRVNCDVVMFVEKKEERASERSKKWRGMSESMQCGGREKQKKYDLG